MRFGRNENKFKTSFSKLFSLGQQYNAKDSVKNATTATQKDPTLETELKFVQNCSADNETRTSLKNICRPDENFPKNIIFSIYFDTYDWYFAMEKAASDYIKTKVRVRWYKSLENDNRISPCFLEIKQKIGSKRQKKRFTFPVDSRDIPEMLTEENCQNFFRESLTKSYPKLSGFDLRPKMLVSYTRHRYYEPLSQSRVAYDTDIHGILLNGKLPDGGREVKLPTSVLEVKGYQQELPYVLRNIPSSNMRKEAFSKYYECFLMLTGYQQ